MSQLGELLMFYPPYPNLYPGKGTTPAPSEFWMSLCPPRFGTRPAELSCRRDLLQRQRHVLRHTQHREAPDVLHVRHRGEMQELLAHALDARRHAFEKIVGVSRNPPALLDARDGGDRALERRQHRLRLAAELDRDERHHLVTEQPLIDDGAHRPDHAAAEQRFQPPHAVGPGHPDAQRQLVVANPPVLLQLGEYFQIDAVELVTPRHSPPRPEPHMGGSEARGGMAAKGRTMGRTRVIDRACPGR